MAKRSLTPEFSCPVCGETVPAGAKSCPECGACEKSGWREGGEYDGELGVSDDEFDYERFVGEEFGSGAPKSKTQWMWAVVAAVLLIALVWMFVGGAF
jgi:hypothetical protein